MTDYGRDLLNLIVNREPEPSEDKLSEAQKVAFIADPILVCCLYHFSGYF